MGESVREPPDIAPDDRGGRGVPLAVSIGLGILAIAAVAVVVADRTILRGIADELDLGRGALPFLVLITLAACLAVGLVLHRVVIRPLRRLVQVMARVSAGDLSVHLPEGRAPASRNEIRDLARSLDHMIQAVATRGAQHAAIAELARHSLTGASARELTDLACRLIHDALHVEHVAVLEVESSGRELELVSGVGWREGAVGHAVTDRSGQAGFALGSGGGVVSNDLANEQRFQPWATLLEHGIRSSVSVAIPGPDGPYGVLGAHSLVPRGFTRDDVAFVTAMASALGSAIAQRSANVDLQAAEARYRNLVEQVPAAVYVEAIDDAETIFYMSPRFEDLTGYAAETVVADPASWIEHVHPDDRERVSETSRRTNETLEAFGMEYRFVRPDGRTVWVRDEARVLHNDAGDPLYWQGVLVDITEHKLLEEGLRQAYDRERDAAEELRGLDQMKNAFLAAVSHELRTPLSSVLGYALTLERSDVVFDDEQRRDLTSRLTVNARKLERLLSDLLDLDRLVRGVVEPRRRSTDLVSLTEGVVTDLAATGRRIDLDIESVVADLDAPKVERILENLIANALKHTPSDGTVWVRIERHDIGILITVEDEGPGVPDELKDAVFQPFHRGSNGDRSVVPGTGIGLTLVAQFAELHGGSAWVEDRPQKGSAFRVFLPCEMPAKPLPQMADR